MAIHGTAISYASFEQLYDKLGMDTHGTTVTVVATDKLINNVLPSNPTCQDCRNQELSRLTYVGPYRDNGLLKGRYTGKDGTVIRTYDIKHNVEWVKNYASKAVKAAVRGNKLNNSTPLPHMKNKLTNDKHFKLAIHELSLIK